MIMNMLLEKRANKVLEDVERLLKDIETYECQNEQWVLNFEDSLNKLSVKY